MLLNIVSLLRDSISHGVLSLEVHLDSQLVVSQLIGSYRIRDSILLQRFLRVRLLTHVPRIFNQVTESYANYVLDWYLFHRP